MTDEYQRAFYIFVIACAAVPVLLAIAVGAFSLGDSTTRQKIAKKTKLDLLPASIRRLAYATGALALFLWTSLVAVAVGGLILTLVITLFRLFPDTTPLGRFFPDTGNWRLELFLIAALTGTLGAMIAFPFTIARLLFTRRQTVAQEEDLLTKRINEAVEGLGAEKQVSRIGRNWTYETTNGTAQKAFQWKDSRFEDLPADFAGPSTREAGDWVNITTTVPNLEVRTGAILALERLAQQKLPVHVQIMQILCAYIRENAAFTGPTGPGGVLMSPDDLPEAEKTEEGESLPIHKQWEKVRARIRPFVSTRTDIRTALEVLSRRTGNPDQLKLEAGWRGDPSAWPFEKRLPDYSGSHDPDRYRAIAAEQRQQYGSYRGYRPDLRGADLRFANLDYLDLRGADFRGAQMQGADLRWAQMQGAVLRGAQMQAAVLTAAQMQGAVLYGAQMQGAVLRGAQMQGADLRQAQMQGADLGWAQMQGADLGGAQMQGADLRQAQMQAAVLHGAKMQGAVLRWAQMQGADLRWAQMQGADLIGAQMQGADLGGAQMQGAVLRGAEMDDLTNITAATLRGAAMMLVEDTTLQKSRPFWPDVFSNMAVGDPDRPRHWPIGIGDEDLKEAWHAWQATLPKGWDRTWPEDMGRPEEDWSDAYRDFRARWDVATRGKAPSEKG